MKSFKVVLVMHLALALVTSTGCGLEEDMEPVDDASDNVSVVAHELGSTITERTLAPHGGGGGVFTGHVTPAAVIYGVQVNSGSKVDRISFFYYQPTRADNIYAGEPLGAVTFGGTGGANRNPAFVCPANQGIIGIRGASGRFVDRIGVICGDVTNPDPFSALNGFSPLWGGVGGVFFDDRCEFGRLVSSFNVRSGSLIDNLQAFCINAR